MVAYEYRCGECGVFERHLPMGAAEASAACPACGRDARRAFSAPRVRRTPAALAAMLDREEASRDRPEVVRRPPERRSPRRSDPGHPGIERLPRP